MQCGPIIGIVQMGRREMGEYISREAAISCVNNYHYPTEPNVAWMSLEYAISALRRIPAADVRPVVLCNDCRHRDPEDHKCDCGQLERAGCAFPVDDDYFCAYGER